MEFQDYYKTLGVRRDDDLDTIKKAYRRKARQFHPDRNADSGAEDQFKAVQEAWEVLQDPEKRRAYDQLGRNWRDGQSFRPPPGWSQAHTPHGEDLGGFSDFFQTLFGGGFGAAGGRPGGGFQGFGDGFESRSAPTQELDVEISLEEAYAGTNRELQRPGDSSLKVRIPPGTTDGTRMRVAAGGRTGTILLNIRLRPHARFTLDGRHVSLDLPLAPWEAALGATVTVPTLGGPIDMKIPPGSQAGQRLRLKGRGLPGQPAAGDQYLRLQIRNPSRLDDEQQSVLRQWQALAADFDPRADLAN